MTSAPDQFLAPSYEDRYPTGVSLHAPQKAFEPTAAIPLGESTSHIMQSAQANHMKIVQTNWAQDIELWTQHLQDVIFFSLGFSYTFLKAFYDSCFVEKR
jgi:hypothetical protein